MAKLTKEQKDARIAELKAEINELKTQINARREEVAALRDAPVEEPKEK